MQNKLKKALKFFGIIALIDLLYLNVFVPVTLSIGQIFLIAIQVVRVCDKKGIDVSTLTSDQLDQLIALFISAVKQMFRANGFQLIPYYSVPAKGNGLRTLLNQIITSKVSYKVFTIFLIVTILESLKRYLNSWKKYNIKLFS